MWVLIIAWAKFSQVKVHPSSSPLQPEKLNKFCAVELMFGLGDYSIDIGLKWHAGVERGGGPLYLINLSLNPHQSIRLLNSDVGSIFAVQT